MRHVLIALGALCLLLTAAYGYSRSVLRAVEAAYPPAGRFAVVEGQRVHYLERGTGEVVVLVHGASTSSWDFEASIVPLLAARHRVIAPDRPGYGHSDRPEGAWVDPAHQARLLHRALATAGVQRATLVGHSLGGAIVLAYALEYPEATAAVALIGGAAYPWEGGVAWTNHVATWPLVGEVFASTVVVPAARLVLPHAVREVFAPNEPSPDYVERVRAELALRPGAFRASAEDVLRLSPYLETQSRRYAELEMPLLLITGEDDDIVPAWNHAHRLARLLPESRLVELPDTGHVPHHVHGERVASLISELASHRQSP